MEGRTEPNRTNPALVLVLAMKMKNKSEMLTLYPPKLFTMHVNDTSRPCGTVKLSSGAKNSGSAVTARPEPK